MFLYLPATKRAINVTQIAAIDEVTATMPDPTKRGGEVKVAGVSVTMIAAPAIDDGEEDGDVIPYSDVYAGEDASVLLAFRDHNLIRQLVYAAGDTQDISLLPLPESARAMDEAPKEEAA